MINKLFSDLNSNDHYQKDNKMQVLSSAAYGVNSNFNVVLDLSRRRDSVETRKTPSPYNSSSFGDISPPSNTPSHDSPTTTSTIALHHSRSGTPLRNTTPNHFRHSPPAYSSLVYHCQPKRETPSPSSENNEYQKHNTEENINPYILQAAALQHRIAQSQMAVSRESDESSETSSFNASSSSSMNPNSASYPMVVGRDGKLARPFKAYPRDPLSMTASFTAADTILDTQSSEKYHSFRKRMLEQIHAANGGQPTISNPKMRRTASNSKIVLDNVMTMNDCKQLEDMHHNDSLNNNNNSDSSNSGLKDSAYFERRKKNNAAAKKSRDRRRIKEDEIAIWAKFLERENIELKLKLASAQKQLSHYGVTMQPTHH